MKLAQIPKHTEEQPHTPKSEAETRPLEEGFTNDGDPIHLYGLDPSDPNYAAEVERLRELRRRDPELFRKMQSLD